MYSQIFYYWLCCCSFCHNLPFLNARADKVSQTESSVSANETVIAANETALSVSAAAAPSCVVDERLLNATNERLKNTLNLLHRVQAELQFITSNLTALSHLTPVSTKPVNLHFKNCCCSFSSN